MKQRVKIQFFDSGKKFNTDGYYDPDTGRLESPFPGQVLKVWDDSGKLLSTTTEETGVRCR